MRLSCAVFEMQRVIYRTSQIFPMPCVFGAPVAVTQLEFHQDVWRQKPESRDCHGRCLRLISSAIFVEH